MYVQFTEETYKKINQKFFFVKYLVGKLKNAFSFGIIRHLN